MVSFVVNRLCLCISRRNFVCHLEHDLQFQCHRRLAPHLKRETDKRAREREREGERRQEGERETREPLHHSPDERKRDPRKEGRKEERERENRDLSYNVVRATFTLHMRPALTLDYPRLNFKLEHVSCGAGCLSLIALQLPAKPQTEGGLAAEEPHAPRTHRAQGLCKCRDPDYESPGYDPLNPKP